VYLPLDTIKLKYLTTPLRDLQILHDRRVFTACYEMNLNIIHVDIRSETIIALKNHLCRMEQNNAHKISVIVEGAKLRIGDNGDALV